MTGARIDKRLNLVIPQETDSGTIYVHSCPIRREIFDKYFLVLSKTFAAIYSEGLNVVAGPRIAYLMMKKIATDNEAWDGPDGIENGLMNEIRRITNVLVPSDNGWGLIPFQTAITNGTFTEDEIDEIEGEIVFFICASAIHRRVDLGLVMDRLASLWGTQTTLLNCTEYKNSLPTSTATESTPITIPASSLPS